MENNNIAVADKTRESWGSPASFLLACVGFAVGLGNIWRFPYLCFKSGGGAFLIPYLVMLLLCGLPLLYMEFIIGQFTRRGPVQAMEKLCPLFKGAGVATVVISFWLSTYYNVILSWALSYLAAAVSAPSDGLMPWTGCNHEWNTENCSDVVDNSKSENGTRERVSSTQEFYDHRILNMTSGLEDFGGVNWELFGYLSLSWVIVYFCLWKSIRLTGKVVYLTATLPYMLLLVFLCRSLTLPGAAVGLKYFLQPKWEKMLEPQVWVYAAIQVFNSIGIAFGSLIAFASYNPFVRMRRGSLLIDAAVIVSVDAATCLLCGLCVFSTMGALAEELGKPVDKVVTEGPGLVFVVFPHALSKLPEPKIWAVVFFSMILLLGIDSQFATVEVIVTSLKDASSSSPRLRRIPHEVLVMAVCAVAFLFGIPHVFQGGIYTFRLVDYFAAGLSLLLIALAEVTAVLWLYGPEALAGNARHMDAKGRKTPTPVVLCWKFVSPVIILILWCANTLSYKPPTALGGKYDFPWWGLAAGWAVAATSLFVIPAMAAQAISTAKHATGIWQRLRATLRPALGACPCGCQDQNQDGDDKDKREENLLETFTADNEKDLENGCDVKA